MLLIHKQYSKLHKEDKPTFLIKDQHLPSQVLHKQVINLVHFQPNKEQLSILVKSQEEVLVILEIQLTK
jgi:hypothetical protein